MTVRMAWQSYATVEDVQEFVNECLSRGLGKSTVTVEITASKRVQAMTAAGTPVIPNAKDLR